MIVYRAAGTAKDNTGSGNMASVGFPAGHALNDILILEVYACDNVVCSVDQGYTNFVATNGGTFARLELWWKRDNGAETAPTVTHAAGNSAAAQLFAFSGCTQQGSPIAASGSTGTVGSKTVSAPTISGYALSDFICFAAMAGNNAGTSGSAQGIASYAATEPPTWSEKADHDVTAGTNDVNGSLAIATTTGHGQSTGAGTALEGWSYTAAQTNTVGSLFALKAARPDWPSNNLRPAIFKPGFSSWR